MVRETTDRHYRPPLSHIRREVILTYAVLLLTLCAAVITVGSIALAMVRDAVAHHWMTMLGHGLFLGIVSFLIYGALVYQLSRLGHLGRLAAHRPAGPAELDRFFLADSVPAVTILVPSYREDPGVIRRTLYSAALQDYPSRRVALLIDDPPHPGERADRERLEAARALVDEVAASLARPRAQMSEALQSYVERSRGRLDAGKERQRLAQLYLDAAVWFAEEAVRYPVADHADRLFVELTFRRPAWDLFDEADRWGRQAASDGPDAPACILDAYRRLALRFRTGLTSFERKRFANLSHEPNKAMNLNSYIGLMGRRWRVEDRDGALHLGPAGAAATSLDVPDSDLVLMVDADSVLAADYTLRLAQRLAEPGRERTAVIQTPYSAFPGAPGALERIAGATTDIQYLIHQGFTAHNATYWVGANALVRKVALEEIAESGSERGYPIRRFILDRTVIEDTESTVDLISLGWRLYNYPERLAFSATPPDFGSLLIQRRRWANGGLLILPKLVRYLARRWNRPASLLEGFMRCHYLVSLAAVNTGLLLVLAAPFDAGVATLWLPLTGLPYYLLYARDLRQCGYRASDVLRVYALNLLLIPVHLGGVALSLRQGWTGRKSPFGRTPKVKDRVVAPPLYLIAEYAILSQWLAGAVYEYVHGRPLHAGFALVNAGFLAYAVHRFIGVRESWRDLRLALGDGRWRLAWRERWTRLGRHVSAVDGRGLQK